MSSLNEDYWYESFVEVLDFDDEDGQPQIFNDLDRGPTVSENSNILPIRAIISELSLNLILDDISSTFEFTVIPPREAISRALLDHKYSLDVYKRYRDKIDLLDSALESSDGNIILKVILFLKSTLCPNILFQQLSKRKLAVKYYANYLIMCKQFQELTDLYMATGNVTNLKQVYFFIGKETGNRSTLYKKIKQFAVENLQMKTSSEEMLEIQNNLKFLEWQIERNQTADNVIEQLAVLCRNERESNQNCNDGVLEFKNLLKIDKMAYEWTVMNVLASMKLWKQIVDLFVKPDWFNKKNVLKTTLSQELFVYGMSKHKPPVNILQQFLNYIPDLEKSLNLALKLHCHAFVVQHYINQKDRLALVGYKAKLTTNDQEFFIISNVLQCADKKWKN